MSPSVSPPPPRSIGWRFFDTLTGLPNRQRFLRALRSALSDAQIQGGQIALLFIDLDFFKRINDNLGHSTGDVLLKSVASRLAGCIRGSDMVSPHDESQHRRRWPGSAGTSS